MAENNSNRIMTENSPVANAHKKGVESQVNNAPKPNATRTNSGGFNGAHSTAQQTSQFQTQTTTTQKFSGAHSTAQSSSVGGSSHPINTDYNNPSAGVQNSSFTNSKQSTPTQSSTPQTSTPSTSQPTPTPTQSSTPQTKTGYSQPLSSATQKASQSQPSAGGNTSGQSSVSHGENVSSPRQPQSPLSQSQSTVNQPSTTQSQILTGTSSSQTGINHATNEYRTNDASTTVNTQSNASHGENISSPSRATSSQSTPLRQSSVISQMSSPKASPTQSSVVAPKPTPSYGGGESASATSVTSTAVRNTVQTAKSSAMVLGSAISTTQQMKNAFKSYEGKAVTMDSLKMGASQIMSKVEQSIVTSDDLGSQSVGGIFESARVGSAIFKASQAVTDAGITVGETVIPKAIQGTATVAKNVGEIAVKGVQGGATVAKEIGIQISATKVTMAQAFAISKEMGISPISKQALKAFQISAVDTGLGSTVISKGIKTGVDSIKNIAGGVKTGVKTVASGIYQVNAQIGLTTVAVTQAYTLAKGLNIMPVSKEGLTLLHQSIIANGLDKTNISQGLVKSVDAIKTGVVNQYEAVKKGLVKGGEAIKTGVTNGIKTAKEGVKGAILFTKNGVKTVTNSAVFVANTVKGVVTGKLSISFVAYQVELMAKKQAGKILTKGVGIIKQYGKPMVKGAIKGTLRGTRAFAPKAWTIGKVGIKGGVKGLRGIKGGAVTIATALGGGDNYALQGVSTAIQTADIAGRLGVAGLKTGANATKGITKVGIKTAKTSGKVVRTFWESYTRTNSIRKAMGSVGAKGFKKVGELLRQAGGSMMSAILSLIKGAGRKLIIPLILIAVVAGGGITIVSAPVMAVGSIFSGIFSLFADDGSGASDWSVENFLVSKVPTLADTTRTTVATEMSADLKANGGSYDIVRLQNMDGSTYNTPDLAGVTDVFYTNEEIVSMIEALFNSLVYMNYELSPTETQANTELNNIYNNIFSYTATPTTEWCGQDLLTGEGTALATCTTVGKIHAIETGANTCPNMTTGTHTAYTDSHCDTNFYTCSGHRGSLNCGKYEHTHSSSCDSLTCGRSEHSHSDSGCTWSLLSGWSCGLSSHSHGGGCYSRTCGCYEHTHSNWSSPSSTGCYSTTYHSNDTTAPNGVAYMSTACGNCTTTMYCIGYAYCNGHGVDTYAFNLDGIYGLLQTIFYDPIEAIESVPEASRTDAQKEQLSTLYDNLEIYNVMTTDVFYGMFGGGMTMADLSGVSWVGGSRTPNQEVVDLALSQVGQVGGQPYWSYYGFGSRVEWCACFVYWCMRNTPSASPAYYTTPNNAYCQTVADYYSSMGQFGHDLSIVTTGDLIFFDWTCDGHTDHIGIVIGRDNEKIYTVEGNSGDQVKVKSYSLSSAVIYGIGYMNY